MIEIQFLDNEQREQVGFSFVLDRLQVITPYGMERKKNIRTFDKTEKVKLLTEYEAIDSLINGLKVYKPFFKEIERIFSKIKDIRNSIKRCSLGEILDDVELYEIKYFALLSEEIYTVLSTENIGFSEKSKRTVDKIKNINTKYGIFNSLEDIINLLNPENKKIPTFYIYESYSEKLKSLREDKRNIEKKIVFEANPEEADILKKERLMIVIQEEEEELEVRKILSKRLQSFELKLQENIVFIGKLDFLMAKAKLALDLGGVKPEINKTGKITFEDIINPEISDILYSKGKSFTPVSISLSSGTTVITGANMGGKSVALKTIILNLLLGLSGFFIFGKNGSFPMLDFIYFVSDDMQSISRGLSTFGAEIIKLKQVIEHVKIGDGFIVLDEFARGTNPKEGFYLVKSVCKFLEAFKSVSLISTHYDGVVEDNMTHYQVIGLKNADLEALKHKIDSNKRYSVEIIQEHMEYKLERVSKESKVPKDALNIAVLLGLDENLVNMAKEFYKEDK